MFGRDKEGEQLRLPFGTRPKECPGCGSNQREWWSVAYKEPKNAPNDRWLIITCLTCDYEFETEVHEERSPTSARRDDLRTGPID